MTNPQAAQGMLTEQAPCDFDIVIVGAGPVGLTLANYFGREGLRTLLVEQLDELIDYPRGVGLDDESLRVFQGLGLASQVRHHTVPDHAVHWVTSNGDVLASVKPREQIYGWPRRNGFIQPLVDRVLFKGLERYPGVEVRLGTTVEDVQESESLVNVRMMDSRGTESNLTASFVIGCDGGKSLVRKKMGVEFLGNTESTQWIVVDIADDPIGTPSVFAVCDSRFPHISVGLPGGVRRFEFMVPKTETEESLKSSGEIEKNIQKVLGNVPQLNIIRSRVYTHHARVASRFRRNRLILAGDAAHLMPVWQGQGYNTGIRDAANLGWKLSAVVRGTCDAGLLDTYDEERRPHATAMVKVSEAAGRLLVPKTRLHSLLRHGTFLLAQKIPPLRRYMTEMKYKPMPYFRSGAVVNTQGNNERSPVGKLMIQPKVANAQGEVMLLDDLLGPGFALICWGSWSGRYLDEKGEAILRNLGARHLVCMPECQHIPASGGTGLPMVLDHEGKLQEWFDLCGCSTVLVRPDRTVALSCRSMDLSERLRSFAHAVHMS
ncbi:MAG: bifunctional 3-(3-hydroxy-phenyl)propionate/3-hydroxycinnamic acid hydroxylase [Pseudomonadota bacterium]